VPIPVEAFEALLEVLGQLAAGNAVQIVPIRPELSTQQAADILNVSRPYLIGLLESGKIPYRKVGAHRRVKYADLIAYKKVDDERGRAALDVLTQEAERMGLGY
jgi:excisionase family DNA binding protein